MDGNRLSIYIQKYHGTIFRLAYSYVKNADDAEDIVQEAFLRLYCSELHFEADENVKAWLIRVSINLCKDMLKSAWLKGRTKLDRDIPYESKEESVVGDCIVKLKPEYRAIIQLYYYEGYSAREIAQLCGISATAATTRLSRARKQLKKLLLKEGYNEK